MLKNQKNIVRFLNSSVCDIAYMPRGAKVGFLFGLELELEGRNVAMEGVPTKGWKRVAEGSLRGEAIEYVFTAPVDYDTTVKLVDGLFGQFRKNDVVMNNSHRTSTHVHLNFADKSVKNVITFFFLHTILEEVLAAYCGESRRGNLFCISARSNEQLIDSLDKAVHMHHNFGDFGENIRYCAANLAALNKFGTIEIRTMRGADNAAMVKDWVDILNQLYAYSCRDDIPSPARILESLSALGADGFLAQFLSPMSIIRLRAAFDGNLDASLMEGVRLVQMLAYKLDEAWQEPFEKAPPKAVAPEGAAHDDPYRGFSARAAARAAERERGMSALYTPQVAANIWWVNPRDRVAIVNGREAHYNPGLTCFEYVDDGTPIRWIVDREGNPLIYGTEREREVNRGYYESYDIFFDHDDDDDNDFDIDIED